MGGRKIRMEYHSEPEGWWAESPDLPGFSAAGGTFAEVREQARGGAEHFADEPLEIEDMVPTSLGMRNTAATSGLVASFSMALPDAHPKTVLVSVVRGAAVPAVTPPAKVNVRGLDPAVV